MAHYLIINTGGTIGMVEGPTGLTPRAGEIEKAIQNIPELEPWRSHSLSWEHWSPLVDSSDVDPSHWYQIKQVIEGYSELDGVLIIHGTDTLAYTSAALSYILSYLDIPVVVTGSMLPVSSSKTDAIDNLVLSLKALKTGRKEVMVAVGNQILPGNRVTKVSTEGTSSFGTPSWDASLWQIAPETKPLILSQPWRNPEVALISLYPGIPNALLTSLLDSHNYNSILINAFGNGNAASTQAMRQLLATAQAKSIPVFIHSQCLEGCVTVGLYAASGLFAEYNVTSCGAMPLEAALTKLQILCSEFSAADDIVNGFLSPVAREWQLQTNKQSHSSV